MWRRSAAWRRDWHLVRLNSRWAAEMRGGDNRSHDGSNNWQREA
jgi:hypothetical protein